MANGSKLKRGNDEYVFVDGRALRADEVVRIDVSDMGAGTAVPGQNEAAMAPGQSDVVTTPGQDEVVTAPGQRKASRRGARRPADDAAAGSADAAAARPADAALVEEAADGRRESSFRRGMRGLRDDEPFAMTSEAAQGEFPIAPPGALADEERHSMRRKYLIGGIILIVAAVVSMCMSYTALGTFHTPLEVIRSIGAWFRLSFIHIFQSGLYVSEHRDLVVAMPYYSDCILSVWNGIKFIICGALLAVSGMLFQNTFRNPIAAPSMLGISNGVNFGIFILVMQFGYAATAHMGLYYIYSFVGGIAVLILVMLGGNWISGPHRFNVVNMILMGTVISQLLGVILTYAEAYLMTEQAWDAYYLLQNATTVTVTATYLILIIGAIVSLLPIFAFRFGLNLVSFSDDESRLIGVNPNRLRVLALGCGSLMMLVAQTTAGQVSMAGLMIPFIVRGIFGSEFRKQLAGNLIVGAVVMLVCSDIGTIITFDGVSIGVGMVTNIVAIPMFVWMLATQQRSWE